MKRSAQISLVLLTTVTMTACSSNDESRMQYNTLQECMQEWNDATLCERDTVNTGVNAAYFLGPYFMYKAGQYYYKRSKSGSFVPAPSGAAISKPGYVSRSKGTVMRGGFGGSKSSTS